MKKIYQLILALPAALLLLAACNPADSRKEIGNSKDTNSTIKAGGPAIRDTATISKDRRDSAKLPASDSMGKGNADPSGHFSKPKQ